MRTSQRIDKTRPELERLGPRGRRVATLVSAKYHLLLLACEPQETLCCRICRITTVLIKQDVFLKSCLLDFDSGEGEAKLAQVAQGER